MAVNSFQDSECEGILENSCKKNITKELTGLLIYRSRSFLQLLEGPEQKVRELYSRIEMDSRHQFIVTLLECKSDERLYPNWSMAFVDESKVRGSIVKVFDLLDDVTKGNQDNAEMILPVLKKFKGAVAEVKS